MTQAQLATAVSLDRSALAKVENGLRRLSAIELARIADALDARIEWFVVDPPPSVVAHRNQQDPGTEDSSIDRLIEKVARHVEFVARHDDRWALAEPAHRLARPESPQLMEDRARQARSMLGLGAGEPLVNAAVRLASVGLLTFSFDLGVNAADAASILLATGGTAVVNGHLKVGRRRLAQVHELGHYLFADDYAVDWRIASHDDDAAWESQLDRFARAVLLPPAGIGALWAEMRDRGDDLRTAAVKLGSVFGVDMATLARRLRELGHVGPSDASAIRAVRTTRADIVEFDLVVNDDFAAPFLPRQYEEAVLRLYRTETVSAARATDLLFDAWAEEDLPELGPLPESAIWKFVS